MEPLSGKQKKYLRGLAHALSPALLVGRDGVTEGVLAALDQALEDHELIKVKFNEFKESKGELLEEMTAATDSALAGVVGHVAMIYRPRREPEKRRILLPA